MVSLNYVRWVVVVFIVGLLGIVGNWLCCLIRVMNYELYWFSVLFGVM